MARVTDYQGGPFESARTPRPQHYNRDSLCPGSLKHPWQRREGLSEKPAPRRQWRQGYSAAINLGRKQSWMNLQGVVSRQGKVGG